MDIPKKIKPTQKVCFESSDTSASEDGDSVFTKYSCTPPSRQNIKGMQKRRELRMLNSPKSFRGHTPEVDKTEKEKKDKSPIHRWQQRETSKQRESERMMKWITSSSAVGSLNTPSSGNSPILDGHLSDDEATNSDVSTPNQTQGIKVIFLIHLEFFPIIFSTYFCYITKVESRNRFMSLCSRLIKLPRKVRMKRLDSLIQSKHIIATQNRTEFQNYFTDLMKSGNIDNTTSQETSEWSEEDLLWQSELKGTSSSFLNS